MFIPVLSNYFYKPEISFCGSLCDLCLVRPFSCNVCVCVDNLLSLWKRKSAKWTISLLGFASVLQMLQQDYQLSYVAQVMQLDEFHCVSDTNS